MDRIAHSQASRIDTRSQVKKEHQETSLRAKSCKYLGVAVTAALLAGSTMASGTEGFSMPEPPSSALDLRGSNNLTDRNASRLYRSTPVGPDTTTNLMGPFSPPPLPSPEYLKKFGISDFERFSQEISRRTSGDKTSQSVTENLSSLRKQGLRLRKKKVKLASLPEAQFSTRSRERISSEKALGSAMETSSHPLERRESKRGGSLEVSERVLALKEDKAAQQGIQDVVNDKEVMEDIKDEKDLTHNHALRQEHSEKRGTHVRKLLARYESRYEEGYKNRHHIFPISDAIHDLADLTVHIAITGGEYAFIGMGGYTAYYAFRRYVLGHDVHYNPTLRRLFSAIGQRWRGGNADRNHWEHIAAASNHRVRIIDYNPESSNAGRNPKRRNVGHNQAILHDSLNYLPDDTLPEELQGESD